MPRIAPSSIWRQPAVATIKNNLATTGFSDRAEVRQADAFAYLRATERSFDLIYVAPPQYKGLWVEAMRQIAARPEVLRRPSAERRTTTRHPGW